MTRSERFGQRLAALVTILAAIGTTTVTAQQPLARGEPSELRIRTALRAFSFSLAEGMRQSLRLRSGRKSIRGNDVDLIAELVVAH